ncbi:MAG: response regulator, partial [Firmicutes bacterium]|nr:response regulator [Bacillota bacterium]
MVRSASSRGVKAARGQAQNGEEGVALALEHIPDIIVSDIMMPRMNGIELTRILKEDIRTSHIPIILL